MSPFVFFLSFLSLLFGMERVLLDTGRAKIRRTHLLSYLFVARCFVPSRPSPSKPRPSTSSRPSRRSGPPNPTPAADGGDSDLEDDGAMQVDA